jgi:hypothetical protein
MSTTRMNGVVCWSITQLNVSRCISTSRLTELRICVMNHQCLMFQQSSGIKIFDMKPILGKSKFQFIPWIHFVIKNIYVNASNVVHDPLMHIQLC